MTMGNLVPEADPEGFIEWVENDYTDERWSNVYQRDDCVTVWSGEYPAFSRFVQDIIPRLHEHGLTVVDVRTDVPKTINGEITRVMWIKAAPIGMAVAAAHDMQCKRLVCREVIKDAESDYCEKCERFME